MRKNLPKVLHISFARKYDYSLFATWQKRLSIATGLTEDYVVQGVRERKFRSSHESAHAYYIPYWLPRYPQYLIDCMIAFVAVLYFVIRRGVVIIISHDPYVAIPVLFGKWVLRALGKPVVVIVEALGDWDEAPFLDGFLPRSLKGPFGKVGDFAFKHADVTRANSPFTASKIKKITNKPCIICPVYVDLTLFLEDADPSRPLYTQQILYAGVLSFRKGVHTLVQAFTQMAPRYPTASLFIIGKGEYRDEILRLIQGSAVAERIQLIPFVSQRELKQYIDSSAMVVLPSFSEGLGRILLEAMACGRPVIVSAIDAVKDLISDGWNGLLFKPGDVQALAGRIEELLEQPELTKKLGVNGKKFVYDHYSQAAFVRGYTLLVETAIGQLPSQVRTRFADEEDRTWRS